MSSELKENTGTQHYEKIAWTKWDYQHRGNYINTWDILNMKKVTELKNLAVGSMGERASKLKDKPSKSSVEKRRKKYKEYKWRKAVGLMNTSEQNNMQVLGIPKEKGNESLFETRKEKDHTDSKAKNWNEHKYKENDSEYI